MRSFLLGEDILLVSNTQCFQYVDGQHIAYLPEELEVIYHLSPDSSKKLHKIKKSFGGEILKEGLKINGTRILFEN